MSAASCSGIQNSFSLYLYGELSFEEEEKLESHVALCPACRLALDRDKRWHAEANAVAAGLPEGLLERSREALHALPLEQPASLRRPALLSVKARAAHHLRGRFFSSRFAAASLLLGIGLLGGRWSAHIFSNSTEERTGFELRTMEVRPSGIVHLVLDRVERKEMDGAASDPSMQQILVSAAQSAADPGLRLNSVELLRTQPPSTEIRDALLFAVRYDANAAVRLKALDALRPFASDVAIRQVAINSLEFDPEAAVRAAAMDVLIPAHGPIVIGSELVGLLQSLSGKPGPTAADSYIQARSRQVLFAVGSDLTY